MARTAHPAGRLPLTPEYLQWAEDTGQTGLLEQAAATNHLCAPGR